MVCCSLVVGSVGWFGGGLLFLQFGGVSMVVVTVSF